ncbi:NAD(P)H-dependent oxidoreductase [Cellulosilyticum sp. I15G10I2]|uniref:NAD(P)H-dependent oxidoreductase n=1 Tax=Cellulosilyticum sp. I15G10I2 TaxID=1892843 RepID=UPI00085BF3E9|nr:NAD(P)H-dependent oxidoreductase [Cellulosilyticum sp. I15G10I2]
MHITLLDATEGENELGAIAEQQCSKEGKSCSYFKLEQMNILPCRNCGACTTKTPGECVFKDDIPEIIKSVVKSKVMVVLAPIRFGGFNAQYKKALDKFVLTGLPFFKVEKGKLSHPGRYNDCNDGMLYNLIIGLSDNHSEGQKQSFKKLTAQNEEIMGTKHRAVIMEIAQAPEKTGEVISGLFKEVSRL